MELSNSTIIEKSWYYSSNQAFQPVVNALTPPGKKPSSITILLGVFSTFLLSALMHEWFIVKYYS
jgi:hypothetical protein